MSDASERWAAQTQWFLKYDNRSRARMYIGIVNQIEEALGPQYMDMTLSDFRKIAEGVVEFCNQLEKERA